jgi:hypothetical protein
MISPSHTATGSDATSIAVTAITLHHSRRSVLVGIAELAGVMTTRAAVSA